MHRRQSEGNETIMLISVLSLTDLYTFFFCHSRVNGNPEAMENTFDVIPAKAGIQETKVLDSASSAE